MKLEQSREENQLLKKRVAELEAIVATMKRSNHPFNKEEEEEEEEVGNSIPNHKVDQPIEAEEEEYKP